MKRPCVAIFDASADCVDMLSVLMRDAGYRAVDAHVADVKRGIADFVGFMVEHDPQVIIWDISPPYQENWNFFQLLRSSDTIKGRGLVLTTTNKLQLDKLAGQDTGAIEIVGKPYDLGLILKAALDCTPSQKERTA